jgi:hypothetical protein
LIAFNPASLLPNGSVKVDLIDADSVAVISGSQGYTADVVRATATAVAAGDGAMGAVRYSATGLLRIVDATAGNPAGTLTVDGFAVNAGRLCISTASPAADTTYIGGVATRNDGAVYVSSTFLMDFVTNGGSINPLVGGGTTTVTRALNTATAVNSSGLVAVVNANLPRFDYDPVTLALKGLLIEESRVNICLQSNDWSSGSWGKNSCTAGAAATTSPDGTANGWKLQETATTAQHFFDQSIGKAASAIVYTLSCYVKAAERGFAYLFIDDAGGANNALASWNLTTGAIVTAATNQGTFTAAAATAANNAGNGWWRLSLTTTSNTALTIRGIVAASVTGSDNFNYAGTLNSGIYTYGAQLEVATSNSLASSYIPTVAAAVTRNVDDISLALGAWYSATEGTVFSEWFTNGEIVNTSAICSIDDGTGNNRILQYVTTSQASLQVINGGVSQADIFAGSMQLNAVSRIASSYKLNDCASAVNGTAGTPDTTATIPTVTTLRLGSSGTAVSFPLNGWLRKIAYWTPKQLNAELPNFSNRGI